MIKKYQTFNTSNNGNFLNLIFSRVLFPLKPYNLFSIILAKFSKEDTL